MKRVDAILCSDLHLTEKTPTCRTDDFQKAMWKKVERIRQLQEQYRCPVLCPGDIGDYWKWSPNLIRLAIKRLPKMLCVYGQHDLPQHNFKLRNKSGLAVLEAAGVVKVMDNGNFGQKIKRMDGLINSGVTSFTDSVLLVHKMIWTGKQPWPGCKDPSALDFLKDYHKYFRLIVSGDNHKPFFLKYKGSLLVNPGSMMRTTATQIDHTPRVYLWEAKTNTVKPVFLPIEKDVISREHIDKKTERENRIQEFVTMFNDEYQATLSFEDNIKEFLKRNSIHKRTVNVIYKVLDSVKGK